MTHPAAPRRRATPEAGVPRRSREKDWQDEAIKAWRTMGATVVVLGHGRRRVPCPACGTWVADYRTQQTRGAWDAIVLWPRTGRTIAVELKSRTGRVGREQRALHATAAEAGLPTVVVRNADDVLRVAALGGISARATA